MCNSWDGMGKMLTLFAGRRSEHIAQCTASVGINLWAVNQIWRFFSLSLLFPPLLFQTKADSLIFLHVLNPHAASARLTIKCRVIVTSQSLARAIHHDCVCCNKKGRRKLFMCGSLCQAAASAVNQLATWGHCSTRSATPRHPVPAGDSPFPQ